MSLIATAYDSPIGTLSIVGSPSGLRAVLWPDEMTSGLDASSTQRVKLNDVRRGTTEITDATRRQLDRYFAQESTTFDLPLDLVGTPFQVKVWRSLADIPFGQTASYGVQADRIGSPTASRAVGAANGRNPVSIVLPCHRVVGASGALTGFAGGLDAKRWLLDFEAELSPEGANTPRHQR